MPKNVPKSFGTHDGTFHADEVMACALLLFFNRIDKDKILRSRDAKELSKCEYVCDVGGVYDPSQKLFDHHQVGYEGALSSAGMILLHLQNEGFIDQKEFEFLSGSLIKGVDEEDNGIKESRFGRCTFSDVIANFLPVRYDSREEAVKAAFFEALQFALGHLTRLVERFQYLQSCREIVQSAMALRKNYMVFDQPIPWQDLFFEMGGEDHPALFLVMPSGAHWKVRGIPPNFKKRMEVRIQQPREWAGLLEKQLEEVSKIPGAIFCHKGLFISVWKTKENAMQALKACLKETR